MADLPGAAPASAAQIRIWALANGFEVSDRGRIPVEVREAFARRH